MFWLDKRAVKVNKLFDLTNQVWRYIVTSILIGQIKQLVNFYSLLSLTIVYSTRPWLLKSNTESISKICKSVAQYNRAVNVYEFHRFLQYYCTESTKMEFCALVLILKKSQILFVLFLGGSFNVVSLNESLCEKASFGFVSKQCSYIQTCCYMLQLCWLSRHSPQHPIKDWGLC